MDSIRQSWIFNTWRIKMIQIRLIYENSAEDFEESINREIKHDWIPKFESLRIILNPDQDSYFILLEKEE
jgi:hypothetical protein